MSIRTPEDESRIEALEKRVGELDSELRGLKEQIGSPGGSVIIPITTLAPEPYELLKHIPVLVEWEEDEYVATFVDGNLGMCGETLGEAMANLKHLIVDVFEELEAEQDKLGPEPARQLAALRSLIRREEWLAVLRGRGLL